MSDLQQLLRQAADLHGQGKLTQAEGLYLRVLQIQPGHFDTLCRLGGLRYQQGRYAEALASIGNALKANPHSPSVHLNYAVVLDALGRPADALASYDAALAIHPDYAEALNNRGLALQSLKRPAEALVSYDRALAIHPHDAEVHYNRGNALVELKRHDEALISYDKAVAIQPNHVAAHNNRGTALRDLERPVEALASYDRALALRPNFAEAYNNRGMVLFALKRYGQALAAHDKALSIRPNYAQGLYNRGNVLLVLKRYAEALAAYDKALDLKPDFAEAFNNRGMALFELKRYEGALAAYDRALALKPDFAEVLCNRGFVLHRLKRPNEAIASYRQALDHGGDAEEIKYFLGGLGAEPMPLTAPKRIISTLFDGYADKFDNDLVGKLRYNPTSLFEDIARYVTAPKPDVLDLGCGTGLIGAGLRKLAGTLVGIDLSSNMLAEARKRQIYDQLICGDLTEFLETQADNFDLIAAGDVFVYVGDLSRVFRAVRQALRARGLFGFSVEAGEGEGFALRTTFRYAHSRAYLHSLSSANRFVVEMFEPRVIRQEDGVDVNGYAAVMRAGAS
jgi:predicted TPR repeat methyltransferase